MSNNYLQKGYTVEYAKYLERVSFISAKTKLLAVIGHPIEHSMSPFMHNSALRELGLDYVYVAFHVYPEMLEKAVEGFKALNIRGVNVTIPHKVSIMQYLDEIEDTARKLGAINTIKNEDGILKAKNTDGEGALKAIHDSGFNLKDKSVVMIGAGGAARAISFYISKEIGELTIVNRDEDFDIAEQLKNHLSEHYDFPINTVKASFVQEVKKSIENADLLINTTPVGMFPNIEKSPVEKSMLHSGLFVFDVIYNPLKTKLMKDAEELGCKTLSGIEMFVNQGWLAFKWWTGKEPNRELMKKVVIKKLGINSQ